MYIPLPSQYGRRMEYPAGIAFLKIGDVRTYCIRHYFPAQERPKFPPESTQISLPADAEKDPLRGLRNGGPQLSLYMILRCVFRSGLARYLDVLQMRRRPASGRAHHRSYLLCGVRRSMCDGYSQHSHGVPHGWWYGFEAGCGVQ